MPTSPIKLIDSKIELKPVKALRADIASRNIDLPSDNVQKQLDLVAHELYNFDSQPLILTKSPYDWFVIEEKYAIAKEAYHEIISSYMVQPRFYKLESVKEKVWKDTKELNVLHKSEFFSDYQHIAVGPNISTNIISDQDFIKKLDDANESFLDPFLVVKPWKIIEENGKNVYVNEITRERTFDRPNEVNLTFKVYIFVFI